jgi:hypothetical protein
MVNRFQRGSAVFACNVCGRKTRYTGTQSLGNKICPQCFDLAGIENEVSDGYRTLEEAQTDARPLVADIKAKGGDVSEWVTTFKLEG